MEEKDRETNVGDRSMRTRYERAADESKRGGKDSVIRKEPRGDSETKAYKVKEVWVVGGVDIDSHRQKMLFVSCLLY